jgi:hypothetical protein
LNYHRKYGIMLPNLQNIIVNNTRHWGRKGGEMRTIQLNNKKSHNRIRSGVAKCYKALWGNKLQDALVPLSPRVYRETLVNHCQAKVYNCHNSVSPLSHPSTFPPILFPSCCHKSLILGYRKSPQTLPIKDLLSPLCSLRLGAFA